MQNLRRSLQNKNSNGGISPTRAPATLAHPSSTTGLAPPRKVIKALYDYKSNQPEELSFQKGDFFHVIGNEDDEDWYEAANPITGARGYVPVTYFQSLEKSAPANGNKGQQQQAHRQQRQRNSDQSLEDSGNDSGAFTDPPQPYQHNQGGGAQKQYLGHGHSLSNGGVKTASSTGSTPSLPKCQPLYGIVLYDFGAERADELDAKAGDAILVIAQSNEEWWVAKPIGRLGGPGLIPVNFVEIRDMVTGKPINVPEMLRQTGTVIPRVEEWKRQAMEYRANSIPLGRIDLSESQPQQQQPEALAPQPTAHSHQPQQPVQQQSYQQQQSQTGPTLQQLKNKLSRDMKAQHHHRNQSQEDVGRRVENARPALPHSSRSYTGAYEDGSSNGNHSLNLHSQQQNRRSADNQSSHSPATLISTASVESFHHEDDQYWFSVRVELASGAVRHLFRLYEDFYNFHIALLEEFPVESGRVGDQPRILPFIPIPLQVVTDTVTASRRYDLNEYVHELCKLPSRITQHPLVEQLFEVKDGDTETPAPPGHVQQSSAASTNGGRHTPSNGMFRGETERRPSPANGAAATRVYGANRSQRSYGDESSAAIHSPNMRSAGFPSLTAAATGAAMLTSGLPSTGPTGPTGTTEEMVKIKISYLDDIMAMRIPAAISFKALQQKIFERLHSGPKDLSYRDDRGDFATLQSDSDIREAIDRSGGKLMIYVD
ncbi:bud emergence protein 1 [Gryganskiella cystojenkinii]|nr:bud emergence protein 1 [Gryganskiella cystojenkinii]